MNDDGDINLFDIYRLPDGRYAIVTWVGVTLSTHRFLWIAKRAYRKRIRNFRKALNRL